MAESLQHLGLVRAILNHITREYDRMGYLALLHDLPGFIGGEKPPRIGGYVPDVYAVDVPSTITIIGEAKTQSDLETAHSHRQILAFVGFLAHQKRGILILAVPWQAVQTARTLLAAVQRPPQSPTVEVVVINGSDLR